MWEVTTRFSSLHNPARPQTVCIAQENKQRIGVRVQRGASILTVAES